MQTSTFFRYFKVNYLKECPFWDERTLCGVDGPGECGICECDENEVDFKLSFNLFMLTARADTPSVER